MHVVVAGASGFLGAALCSRLVATGHEVTKLVRSQTTDTNLSFWDPATGRIDQVLIDQAAAVVNLSGASIARWPWSGRYKQVLWSSRIDSTTTLRTAIVASSSPTRFISASAMGWYGSDRGQELLSETSAPGTGFLARLCNAWESATGPVSAAGYDVALLRTGLPLHESGGILKSLLPVFRLGAGARIGNGEQLMSVLALDDWVRAVEFLLSNTATGPFNLCINQPVTNAEFTSQLATSQDRRAMLFTPKLALRAALGEQAENLTGSLGMTPTALTEAGFRFNHPDLQSTIGSALSPIDGG